MVRNLLLMVMLARHGRKVAAASNANAIELGTAIGGAVVAQNVIAAAAGIITVVGAIVVTLKLGPGWAFKMVSKMVRAVR